MSTNSGIYHYCGNGITTWYEFAKQIFQIVGELGLSNVPMVTPITTSQFPTAAKRPLYTALDCSEIQKNFGIRLKPWRVSLKQTIHQIIDNQDNNY
jgi:dTDP-4-dehydrorhamnose reductase